MWSLITVTHNSANALREHWAPDPPSDVEWIVVDNASSDDSSGVAVGLGAAQLLELRDNRGFGFANNLGLHRARGRYVAFVNPDVRVDYSSLAALQDIIDGRGGLAAPQLTYPDGTLQPNGRGFPTIQNKIANRAGQRHQNYFIIAGPGEVKPACWVIGAALAGRAETFLELEGWDERYFIYYEDSDIGMRAWASGHPVHVVGDAVWVHGWARATTRFAWRPWAHEIASASKFYSRYPALMLPDRRAQKRYSGLAELIERERSGAEAPVGGVV